jgi:hypothetical protein
MLLRFLQMLQAPLNDIRMLPLKRECQIHLAICALRDDVLYTARGADGRKGLNADRWSPRDEKGREACYVFNDIIFGQRTVDYKLTRLGSIQLISCTRAWVEKSKKGE